jgi:hypothetical protein
MEGPPVVNNAGAARMEAMISSSSSFNLFNLVALLAIASLAFFLYKRYKAKMVVKPPTVVPATPTPLAVVEPTAVLESTKEE